ncbi:hypothetical protein B0T26DRAFT_658459 [Lasiosphaeria miniovina]|uniref:Uncharacterized protein n=1 Tax=Lasiosphaeria miniovina TaxID=1954250 RepID=A0AA40DHQ8_9PEZI|nr:uncharacterized protein B0T26DRAFT_658459 [Lasiosphaeria miniovina]KAK0703999.1 hypothetical protein B0T26DRAFT_658459 [Lasiosphaeria miniovina]
MSLQSEVEQIQKDLDGLKARLDAFETKSKATIQEDHGAMLAKLQSSVNAVESTVVYLETGTSRLAGLLELHQPAAAAAAASKKALAKRHLLDMDAQFTLLHGAASAGLERVEAIKKTGDDMHGELGAIRTKLESLSARAASALDRAGHSLGGKQTQLDQASQSLATTQQELSALEAQMKGKKNDRDAMRVARVATWGMGLVFPPMLIAAGALEGAAYDMRKNRERLQGAISAASTRQSSLRSEAAALAQQKQTLSTAVQGARELLARAQAMGTGSRQMQGLVAERLAEYQALKESSDEFAAWTRDLQTQTTAAGALGTASQARLLSTTARIVDALLDKDQGDVKRVCGKLRRLEIGTSRFLFGFVDLLRGNLQSLFGC